MKTRSLLVFAVVILMMFVATTAIVQAQNSQLTPQRVREILYGPATKNITPMQREAIWNRQCYSKKVSGEGVIKLIQRQNLGGILGERWVMVIDVEEPAPKLRVFFVVMDPSLPGASSSKSGEKVRFSGELWKIAPSVTGNMPNGANAVFMTLLASEVSK